MSAPRRKGDFKPKKAIRALVIAELLSERDRSPRGRLSSAAVLEAAKTLGLSASTIRRDLARGGYEPAKRKRCEIGPVERSELMRHGSVAAAYDALVHGAWRDTGYQPSYVTFWRAFDRDVEQADWIFWREGDAAAREFEAKLKVPRDHWLLVVDAKVFSIWVRHPDTGKPVQPRALHARWPGSGLVARPITSPDAFTKFDVGALLKNALLPDPEWSPAHGLPSAFAHDNGPEFLGDALTWVLMELCLPSRTSKGYSPWQNGGVETYHAFAEGRSASHPFYAHGPQQLDGTAYLPDLDLMPDFADWAEEYAGVGGWLWNHNHTWHRRGDRFTAVENWERMAAKPPPVPAAAVAWLDREFFEVTARPEGVQVKNVLYMHKAIPHRIPQRLVAGVDRNRRDAEVFTLDGEYVCRAINVDLMTDDEHLDAVVDRTSHRAARHREKRENLADLEEQMRRYRDARIPVKKTTDESDRVQAQVERFRRGGKTGLNEALPDPG
jgi:hypothetical protein